MLSCKDGQWLYDATRFVHCVVDVGGEIWHSVSVYGYTNSEHNHEQRALNEALFSRVLGYIASLGAVRLALCTDLNTTPEASACIRAAIGRGELWDAGALVAQAQGGTPEPTCFAHEESVGTRRDYIFTNACATPSIRGFDVAHNTGIPTHKPVVLSLETTMQKAYSGKVLIHPRPFSFDYVDPDPGGEDLMASHTAALLISDSAQEWEATMATKDPNAALALWSRVSEHYFGLRSFHEAPPSPFTGRAQRTRLCERTLTNERSCDQGVVELKVHRIQKLTRRVEELVTKLTRRP